MTHLQTLQQMLTSRYACNLQEHSTLASDATFIVEEDEAYFVLADQGKFYAIIGQFHVDADDEPVAFEVNAIYEFTYRDSAIACALAIATNDSGGADCIREIARERAPYFTPY